MVVMLALRFTCRFGSWKYHTRQLDPPVGHLPDSVSNISLSSTSDVVNVSPFPNVAILSKSQKVMITLFWISHKTIRDKVKEIHRIMAGDGEPLSMLTEEGEYSESWLEATDRVMNDEVFFFLNVQDLFKNTRQEKVSLISIF